MLLVQVPLAFPVPTTLALKGYPVTIFERLGEPGGMAAMGIPDYRLPRDIVGYEAEIVKSLGVEIRYNTQVGKDIMG
jgi:formate dehydrogenase beta subunit